MNGEFGKEIIFMSTSQVKKVYLIRHGESTHNDFESKQVPSEFKDPMYFDSKYVYTTTAALLTSA